MSLFSPIELEDTAVDRLPGCRLRRLEVFNWGTFDKKVWSFDVSGRNALLTGNIGSGKSTLVDAMTTLLLPSHKISYNKAAGAETRERDLRSYVQGYYRSERIETTGTSRPVSLRGEGHYSVILGVFENRDFDTVVTLAQVFWTKNASQGQPERFFVVAESDLSIAEDFKDFGTEITGLRRKLRDQGFLVRDSFSEYGKDFRRRLGIESEQAMELFHQTVSMKAVDNLNDFVRSHMLEPFDMKTQITTLVEHFDDLTRAHEAVVRARVQLELLTPLIDDLDDHEDLSHQLDEIAAQLRASPYFFAERKQEFLLNRLQQVLALIADLTHQIEAAEITTSNLRDQDKQLDVQIAGNGGNRLISLETQLSNLQDEKITKRRRSDQFNELLASAGIERISAGEQFAAVKHSIESNEQQFELQRLQTQNDLTEVRVEQRQLEDNAKEINDELHSLRSRRTNLPMSSLRLRSQICEQLNLDETLLPFVGELIQVRADASEWEGAAERLLHNFALSMLVPDDDYERVAAWVDGNHIGGRLVYYRVPTTVVRRIEPSQADGVELLVDKLDINPESPYVEWIEGELDRRANYVCVTSTSKFRGTTRAITRGGQIKDNNRHEKDDRKSIDDRRNYVLGWSNQKKIDALFASAEALQRRLAEMARNRNDLEGKQTGLNEQLSSLKSLHQYEHWEELDWESVVNEITKVSKEIAEIERSSDLLTTLREQQEEVRGKIAATEICKNELFGDRGGALNDQKAIEEGMTQTKTLLDDTASLEVARVHFEAIGKCCARELQDMTTSHPSRFEQISMRVSQLLGDQAESKRSKLNSCMQRALRKMGDFSARYPQETAEFDVSIESRQEYRQLHARVAGDDLPRFEQEFKEYLNKNTINDIAMLAAQLNKQEALIRERVEKINASLVGIEYNSGRYIRLLPDRTPNIEVRDFIEQLRNCTSDVVGGGADDEQYSEAKFLEVKQIVDRFKGREGMTDLDRVWTRRVTDVRNRFVFSASEYWKEDDSEYENYANSGGKSGGQKEKLAYTILAASLAYQFKLDWGSQRSRAFRFVVIDEAFGRGSEDSTRYALDLFRKLGLQLLIVTPLQKIHVIAPYVSTIGFVTNPNDNYSQLRRITIEDYFRERNDHKASE